MAAAHIHKCLTQPGANCFYIAVTRGQARRNFWDSTTTGLKKLNQDYGLGIEFHNTNLEATFPNGSKIALVGADSPEEIDKLRGVSVDLATPDEAGSFRPAIIDSLIEDILGPPLNDRMGTLCISGTPGYVLAGTFYLATTRNDEVPVRFWNQRDDWGTKPYAWSFHSWDVLANTAMPHLWQECLAQKEMYGWSDDNPRWLREYMGRWVVDNDSKIYKYDRARNGWSPDPKSDNRWGLPSGHDWQFILGCDLGYEDDFAIVVTAYSDTCPVAYQVYEYACPKLSVSQVAHRIKKVEEDFGGFVAMVADTGGLAKMVVQTLASDYDVMLEPADRTNKRDAIELVNSDLLEGQLKILRGGELEAEYEMLVWDEDKKREAKGQRDHVADAKLYTHKYALHHHWKQKRQKPERGSPDYWAKWEREQEDKAAQEWLAKETSAADAALDNLDRDFHEDPFAQELQRWI